MVSALLLDLVCLVWEKVRDFGNLLWRRSTVTLCSIFMKTRRTGLKGIFQLPLSLRFALFTLLHLEGEDQGQINQTKNVNNDADKKKQSRDKQKHLFPPPIPQITSCRISDA